MGNCVNTKMYAGVGIFFFVGGVITVVIGVAINLTIGFTIAGCPLLGISVIMAAYRCYYNCNTASTESAPLLYTATPIAVPPTKPSTPQSSTRLQFRYHGFLTHTWMKDELGRRNHDRVTKIFDGLKRKGLNNWFDGEKMQDDVVQQMIGGIDESNCIVVFLTKAYIEKVASGNPADNCFKEFSYANRTKTSAKMIAVPMEPCCLDPKNWTGIIQMELGGLLYEANFAKDDDPAAFNENIEKLYQQIRRKCAQ
jgi:hypothetical protein